MGPKPSQQQQKDLSGVSSRRFLSSQSGTGTSVRLSSSRCPLEVKLEQVVRLNNSICALSTLTLEAQLCFFLLPGMHAEV